MWKHVTLRNVYCTFQHYRAIIELVHSFKYRRTIAILHIKQNFLSPIFMECIQRWFLENNDVINQAVAALSWRYTYLLTYSLTPWCRVLPEQLTGLQLLKKFPAFHGTRRLITALTSVRHLSLSWASPIQSTCPHHTSWRSILILSTHLRLGLPGGLLPSGYSTKTLYTPLSSPMCATCPAHLILLDFIPCTILGEE